MKRKELVTFGEYINLSSREDAHLLLVKPAPFSSLMANDFEVIRFPSRLALEQFNKKANLSAVVKTQVPLNCVIYKHQSDSDARARVKE